MERKTFKEKLIGNEKIFDTSLFIQCLLLPIILILGVCSIFINEFVFVTECMTSLTLLVMAYNNYKYFNRTGLTFIYILVALLVMVLNVV